MFKEKRRVVQGLEKNKADINEPSVEWRLEGRRTVLEPDLPLERHEHLAKSGTKGPPVFDNVFMSFYCQIWLQKCPSLFKPLLYRQYFDDCSVLFRSLIHVPLFLDHLNQQHPNSLTSTVERAGKLPFFDLGISRSQGKSKTSVYRKPTFIGLFTKFLSFIQLTYKRCLVSCLISVRAIWKLPYQTWSCQRFIHTK